MLLRLRGRTTGGFRVPGHGQVLKKMYKYQQFNVPN